MLRNFNWPSNFNETSSARCGDIICHDSKHFSIVCILCKLKLFQFDDFILHYRNVHLHTAEVVGIKRVPDGDDEEPICPIDTEIHDEEFENVEYLAESEMVTNDLLKCDLQVETSFGEPDQLKDPPCETWSTSNNSESENNSVHYSGDENKDWQPFQTKNTNNEEYRILKKRKPKEYVCEQCPKRYTTERILKVHIKMQHLRPKAFKCDQCNEAFSEQRCLESHIRNVHVGFTCNQCNRIYKSAHSLKAHSHSHKETKDFICQFENCGKAFVTSRRLKSHQKIHTEERNHICEICGYRTRQKEALIIHKRTHTGEKPFVCIVCSRRFTSASLLNEHKAMHSTERPHKCDVCGSAFSRAKALYHHKHLHLGIKKFACKLCGRAYAQMAGLAGHMRQHRMEDRRIKSEIQ